MCGYGLGKHGFTSARGSEEQNSLPRPSDASEVLRHQDRQEDCFLKNLFGLVQIGDIIEIHLRISVDDVSFQSPYQIDIRAVPIWIAVE